MSDNGLEQDEIRKQFKRDALNRLYGSQSTRRNGSWVVFGVVIFLVAASSTQMGGLAQWGLIILFVIAGVVLKSVLDDLDNKERSTLDHNY